MIKNFITDKLDIIILAGQSNASGCGLGETETPWVKDERILKFSEKYSADVAQTEYGNEYLDIKIIDEQTVSVADERNDGKGQKISGFDLAFAKEYANKYLEKDRKLLIVDTSIGGTGFSKKHWGVGDLLYERMFRLTDLALSMNNENRIVAVLWHQGEHDTFENAQFNYEERFEFYKSKFGAFMQGLRAKYGEQPFICAGFTSVWVGNYPEQCKAVLTACKEVLSNYSKTAMVNTEDLKNNDAAIGNKDIVHFSKDACYKLGRRYFKAFEEIK